MRPSSKKCDQVTKMTCDHDVLGRNMVVAPNHLKLNDLTMCDYDSVSITKINK